MGDSRADETIVSVIWEDPETKSRAELADAMTKEVSAGVPLALAMQRAKFSPEEIEFALKERRKEQARAMALQAASLKESPSGGGELPEGEPQDEPPEGE
jgi:hypothetical protein